MCTFSISRKEIEQHIQIAEEIESNANGDRPNIVIQIMIESVGKWNEQEECMQDDCHDGVPIKSV